MDAPTVAAVAELRKVAASTGNAAARAASLELAQRLESGQTQLIDLAPAPPANLLGPQGILELAQRINASIELAQSWGISYDLAEATVAMRAAEAAPYVYKTGYQDPFDLATWGAA